FVVDAFAEKSFEGNPAAVVLFSDTSYPPDEILKKIAREFNLSETAFLTPHPFSTSTSPHYNLRWFTPKLEIELCGHATLASAFSLFSSIHKDNHSKISFHTLSGVLETSFESGSVSMSFPDDVPVPVDDAKCVEVISRACGLKVDDMLYVGRGRSFFLCVVVDETKVDLKNVDGVDEKLLQDAFGEQAIILTAKSRSSDADFTSRVFGINIGIKEDPVTGSAHCLLAPLWINILGSDTVSERNGKLKGYQASERGGYVGVEWLREKGIVRLTGSAVMVAEGKMYL
ncbi:hypothetical protein HK098_004656, partial [Nowakowskiella sp. JEL0407]